MLQNRSGSLPHGQVIIVPGPVQSLFRQPSDVYSVSPKGSTSQSQFAVSRPASKGVGNANSGINLSLNQTQARIHPQERGKQTPSESQSLRIENNDLKELVKKLSLDLKNSRTSNSPAQGKELGVKHGVNGNEQLQRRYHELQGECEALQRINVQLQNERNFMMNRLADFEVHTDQDNVEQELESKMVLMSMEIMRLGQLSRTRTQENTAISLQLEELHGRYDKLQKELAYKDRVTGEYSQEIRQLRERIKAMEEGHQLEITRLKQTLEDSKKTMVAIGQQEMNRTILYLTQQLERLSYAYSELSQREKNKTLELENITFAYNEQKQSLEQKQQVKWSRSEQKITTFESKKIIELEQVRQLTAETQSKEAAKVCVLETELAQIKEEVERVEKKLLKEHVEKEDLLRQKEVYMKKQISFQQKINSCSDLMRKAEITSSDRQSKLREALNIAEENLISRTAQLSQTRQHVAFLEQEGSKLQKVRAELASHEQTIRSLRTVEEVELRLRVQKEQLTKQVTQLIQQQETDSEEKRRWQTQCQTLKAELSDKDKRMKDALRERNIEIDRYTRQIKELAQAQGDYQELQKQMASIEKMILSLQDQARTLRHTLATRTDEYESLSLRFRRVAAESQELDQDLKKAKQQVLQSSKAGEHLRELQDELAHSREQAAQMSRREKGYQQKLAAMQEQMQREENNYEALSSEIERLNELLADKLGDIVGHNREVDLLKHQCSRLEERLLMYQSQSSHQELQQSLAMQKELNQAQVRKHLGEKDQLQWSLQQLREELKKNALLCDGLTAEKGRLEQRCTDLTNQLSSAAQKLTSKVTGSLGDDARWKDAISEIRDRSQELSKQVLQLQVQNHALTSERDQQVEEWKVERMRLEMQIKQLKQQASRREEKHIMQQNREGEVESILKEKESILRERDSLLRENTECSTKLLVQGKEMDLLLAIKSKNEQEVRRLVVQHENLQQQLSRLKREGEEQKRTILQLEEEARRLSRQQDSASQRLAERQKMEAIVADYAHNLQQALSAKREAEDSVQELRRQLQLSKANASELEQQMNQLRQETQRVMREWQLFNETVSQTQRSAGEEQTRRSSQASTRAVAQLKEAKAQSLRLAGIVVRYEEELTRVRTQNVELVRKIEVVVSQSYASNAKNDNVKNESAQSQLQQERLQSALQVSQSNLQRMQQEKGRMQSLLREKDNQLGEQETKLRGLREELFDKETIIGRLKLEVEQYSISIRNAQTDISKYQSDLQRYQTELNQHQMAKLEAENAALRTDINRLAAERDNSAREAARNEALRNEAIRGELARNFDSEGFRMEMSRLQGENEVYRGELNKLQTDNSSLRLQLNWNQIELSRLATEASMARKQLANITSELGQYHAEITRYESDTEQLRRALASYQAMQEEYSSTGEQLVKSNGNFGTIASTASPRSMRPVTNRLSLVTLQTKNASRLLTEASKSPTKGEASGGTQTVARNIPCMSINQGHTQYELLQTAYIQATNDGEGWRRKCAEYKLKMSKLREEFEVLSRIANDYRLQNDRLKARSKSQAARELRVVYPPGREEQGTPTRRNVRVHLNGQLLASSSSELVVRQVATSRKNLFRVETTSKLSQLGQQQDSQGFNQEMLLEEIAKLKATNEALERELQELRGSFPDAHGNRAEEYLMTMMLLFVEVRNLRSRLTEREAQLQMRKS